MAEYRYACKNCAESFNVQRAMKETNPAQIFCPKCYSMEIIRIWEVVPVFYHTHGFYSTDVASAQEYDE
jgi:putative FmdB family regulatory protein